MSSEIKNTIGLLCKLLNLIYKTNLKPEHFRLAKFNKTDENVVPILWNLLVKVLNEDDINYIKRKLYHLNYKRNQFYTYMGTNGQSRELLLAIGFLITIYLEDVVNNELNNSVSSENYEPLESYQTTQHLVNGHHQFNWQKLNNDDLENYKKWICGKTCSNKINVLEYKEHILKMQEKFNKVLDIKANGTLTVHEILALKSKTIGDQFIQDTELVLSILSVYTEWLKKEKYFWKWMESVLMETKKEIKSEI